MTSPEVTAAARCPVRYVRRRPFWQVHREHPFVWPPPPLVRRDMPLGCRGLAAGSREGSLIWRDRCRVKAGT